MRIVSVLASLVLFCVLVFIPSPVSAAECYLEPLGESPNFRVVCTGLSPSEIESGIVTGEIVVILPTETVTIPPVTLPPLPAVTVTDITEIVGPTATVTIPGPLGPTQTVTVPGPTTTEIVPGQTETFFLPGPTVTASGPVVTKTPEATPQPTVTETTTVTNEVEVDRPQDEDVLFDPPPLTVVETVGLSVLALLIICGLIILALWMGYVLGYKDKQREEQKFLSALRDQFYYKGNHS